MIKGLYTAYTGMINEQNRMDTLANNLANVDTTGFKKEGATSQAFGDILKYEIKDKSEYYLTKRMGVTNPGVRIGENYTNWDEGAFHETNNTFDVALSGSGFFAIEFTTKDGVTSVKYTRDGSFTLNQQGALVTKDGDFVLDADGHHIVLDPNKLASINTMGQIYQDDEYVTDMGAVDFENYDYLEHHGENLWQPVEGATEQPADVRFYSGYLEQSNVNTVEEMVNMIAIQRQYESNQKVITTLDRTLQIAANDLGKL
jgi:flagellar basal-body rod protein FlgG